MKAELCAVIVLSASLLAGVSLAEEPTVELIYDFGARTRYETSLSGYGNMTFEVRREAALARVGWGDFFVMGGVIHDGRIEQANDGYYYPMPLAESASYGYYPYQQPEDPVGDGFIVAAGLRNTVWQKNQYSLAAYGLLSFWSEFYTATAEYSSYAVYEYDIAPAIWPEPSEPVVYTETYDIVIQGTELLAGLVGSYSGKRYTVYGGVEVLPYSDVEAAVTLTSYDGSTSSERENSERSRGVTFLLGLKASFNRVFVKVETRSLGEKSLRAGAGITF